MDIDQISNTLRHLNIDAFLIYDFRGSDIVSRKILKFEALTTRRWVALITKEGKLQLIIPKLEKYQFSTLEGEKILYLTHNDLEKRLQTLLKDFKNVVLNYSPANHLPTLDLIPAGFLELLKKLNPNLELVPSADFTQHLAAKWSEEGYNTHKQAAQLLKEIADEAYDLIKHSLNEKKEITDFEVAQFILKRYKENNLMVDDGVCVVSTGQQTGNPHYFPTQDRNYPIKPNSLLLFDMWAKLKKEKSIYADVTFMAWIGPDPIPEKIRQVWEIVKEARDLGIDHIKQHINKDLKGFEVDRKVRAFIASQGFGENFIHRTGHSIDTQDHGSGANIDDFETEDSRMLLPDSGFSIEPGIYLEDFGIRSEVDMYIHPDKSVEVTTFIQEELHII